MVTMAYLGARLLVLGFGVSLSDIPEIDNPLVVFSFPWRALNALGVGFHYFSLLIFPLHLSYDYSWDQIRLVRSLDDLRWVAWALGGAAGFVALLWSFRRAPQLFFALAFFLITFSVVSNVPVTIGTILGERLLYMPSLGFCLALLLLLRRLAEGIPGSVRLRAACFLVPVAILVGAHAARTLVRNADWESTVVLFLHDAEVVPGSLKARSNAGAALYRMERPAEALEQFERAIERCPSPLFFQNPYNGKVFSLLALERYAEAEAAYQVLLQHGLRLSSAEAALALWRAGQGGRD
jgi:tetratricopeptide (TPR) repeat protein